jgi:long-subunit fatty acid transport protein
MYAQGEIDALRFSKTELSGTARGQAMGGAFGALGGDATGITINPAGIAVYRTSELSGTLGLTTLNTEASWLRNAPYKNDKTNFNLENISYVGYYPVGDETLQSINFGFSYSKAKNFSRNYSVTGKDMRTSLTDYIEELTWKTPDANLTAKDAYNGEKYPDTKWLSILGRTAGLINPKPQEKDEYQTILRPGELVNPHLDVSERGYIDNYDFTIGMNLSNTFYLGFTLSWIDIYYRMNSQYKESFGNMNYTLDNYLQTDGSGYGVNIGAIWLPTNWLRLGAAYHSPTWYVLRDSYGASITPKNLRWGDSGPEIPTTKTPDDNFEYHLRSPQKWVFSAAAVLDTKAIVSMDYEIKNYRGMYLEYNDGRGFRDNEYIETDFKSISTLRAGLEYRFTSQFSGRLGYSWMQHPYEQKFKDNKTPVVTAGTVPHYTIEGDANYFTAGIGYRFTPRFYMDIAFVYRTQTDDLYFFPKLETNRPDYIDGQEDTHKFKPYYPVASSLKNVSFKSLVTLGYKF